MDSSALPLHSVSSSSGLTPHPSFRHLQSTDSLSPVTPAGHRASITTASSQFRTNTKRPTTSLSQITHEKVAGRDDSIFASKRSLYDLEGWSLLTNNGQARYLIASAAYSRPFRILMTMVVCAYLCLGFAAILFDMSVVCINPRHGTVKNADVQEVYDEESIHRIRRQHEENLRSSQLMQTHVLRKTFDNTASHMIPDAMMFGHFGDMLEPSASSAKQVGAEPVLLCDSLYATQASGTSHVVGLACLTLCGVLFFEHVLRLFSIGAQFVCHDYWLLTDFILTTCSLLSDMLVVSVLRPRLVQAFQEDRKDEVTMWIIFFCRLWRVNFLWRIVRTLRGEHPAGEEVIRAFQGMSLLLSKNSGMSSTKILRVQVIKNSAAESKLFQARVKTMRMRQSQGVKEQLLFFGSSLAKPSDIIEREQDLDNSFFSQGMVGIALYGAEKPAFSDACHAFTDWEADPSGRTRQLLIFRALLGKVQEVNPEDGCDLERADLGYNSVFVGPCVPDEYQPDILGVRRRDIASMAYAFHEPLGQVLLVAVVTYQNPDCFDEIDKMVRLRVRSWQELCILSQQLPSGSPEQAAALLDLEDAIDQRSVTAQESAMLKCKEVGASELDIERVNRQQRTESEDAGISLAYILSEDFAKMAREATGKDDPTFLEMADPLFKETSRARIGEGLLCPRDLRPGCSFIDALPRKFRRKATHFMSWVWRYKLSMVVSCLTRWALAMGLNPEDVFLYVCFFCNNQWRILVEQSSQGSDNLEVVFEARLLKIGKAVALMDSWSNPLYITRIWTIYEQYVIAKLGLEAQFALPTEPAQTLIEQLDRGKQGLELVIEAISKVDAENAEASMKQDEDKVKGLISSSFGFAKVNQRVKMSITEWVANEFKTHIDRLVGEST